MACPSDATRDLRVALDIALAAGKMITDTCGQVKSIGTKQSFADLVTETDKNVEKYVFEKLREKFPSDKFIGEEGMSCEGGSNERTRLTCDRTWIVDPVDGTMNFVHTFPHVAVCIGLAIEREPVLGVVYCPAQESMYWGHRSLGAFCNGRPIKVRESLSLKGSLVCTEIGSDRSDEKRKCVFDNLQSISWRCHGIRCLGSAALNICSVATGQSNAFYEFGLHCWDMCAPVAILRAAGGFACDTSGKKPLDIMSRRLIVACNETIALELSEALVNQMELDRDDDTEKPK